MIGIDTAFAVGAADVWEVAGPGEVVGAAVVAEDGGWASSGMVGVLVARVAIEAAIFLFLLTLSAALAKLERRFRISWTLGSDDGGNSSWRRRRLAGLGGSVVGLVLEADDLVADTGRAACVGEVSSHGQLLFVVASELFIKLAQLDAEGGLLLL